MNQPTLSIVVPLWNEGKNIEALVKMFENSDLRANQLIELILVNNGSTDNTEELVRKFAELYPWIVPIHLPQNLNYGGGIQKGLEQAKGDYLGFVPGDLQVKADDIEKVWDELRNHVEKKRESKILAKGWRTVRHDGMSTRFVSFIYTLISNIILGIWVKDLNALPKIFHRDLLRCLPSERVKTFVFDAQILLAARKFEWNLIEVPVVFHARREGVSSWSGKRLKVYLESFKLLFKIRKLALQTRSIDPLKMQETE